MITWDFSVLELFAFNIWLYVNNYATVSGAAIAEFTLQTALLL